MMHTLLVDVQLLAASYRREEGACLADPLDNLLLSCIHSLLRQWGEVTDFALHSEKYVFSLLTYLTKMIFKKSVVPNLDS
jgi:hypothetical protein